MTIAWCLFASVGIIMARYGKDLNASILGKKIWFRTHQFCMITTWLLTISGVGLIYLEKGFDPLKPDQIYRNPHGLIGLLASIFAFIQPFMAILRPGPESSKRWIFNYSHLFAGTISILFSITALLLMSGLDSLKIDQETTLIATIVFAASYVTIHILCSLASWTLKDSSKNKIIVPLLLFTALIGGAVSSVIIYCLIQ